MKAIDLPGEIAVSVVVEVLHLPDVGELRQILAVRGKTAHRLDLRARGPLGSREHTDAQLVQGAAWAQEVPAVDRPCRQLDQGPSVGAVG